MLQYKNGERYEGQWRSNFANGTQRLFYLPFLYLPLFLLDPGRFVDRKLDVIFIFIFPCSGVGTLSYADGDKYIGEWKDGKKSGKGELVYINGDKFRYCAARWCFVF